MAQRRFRGTVRVPDGATRSVMAATVSGSWRPGCPVALDDHQSMAANNTSAFNCLEVAGRPGVWSQHAYGLAIDLNPIQNPFVDGRHVSPAGGRAFLDRARPAAGVITDGGGVVAAFARAGWGWGGHWRAPRDYQHFSANGR